MPKNKRHDRKYTKTTANFSAQHRLINKRLIEDLIDLAKIGPGDTALDIGAGTGAITLPLANKAGIVLAIENDPVFAGKLANKIKEVQNIQIKQIDFLQFHLPKNRFTVVANIPYSITTPIFGKLLDQPAVPLQTAVLVVEKGAAKRFTAIPVADPRILAWRMWFDIRLVRTVPPNDFSPPPSVDSAVVTIRRKPNPAVPAHHHAKFQALASYGLRYPQLPFYAAMADVFTPPQIAKLVRAIGIARETPIGFLNERQWGELFLAMLRHVHPGRWPTRSKSFKRKNKKR